VSWRGERYHHDDHTTPGDPLCCFFCQGPPPPPPAPPANVNAIASGAFASPAPPYSTTGRRAMILRKSTERYTRPSIITAITLCFAAGCSVKLPLCSHASSRSFRNQHRRRRRRRQQQQQQQHTHRCPWRGENPLFALVISRAQGGRGAPPLRFSC
jgi:hypothetical protein